jgi:hypothetical protein
LLPEQKGQPNCCEFYGDEIDSGVAENFLLAGIQAKRNSDWGDQNGSDRENKCATVIIL